METFKNNKLTHNKIFNVDLFKLKSLNKYGEDIQYIDDLSKEIIYTSLLKKIKN